MNYKKVYIEITNICNKNCSFCSVSNRKKNEMTLEEFKIVISKIKKYTQYIYLHIKGEPLLHSKLKDILSVCLENDIKVNITTNGSLLNKNKELLCESKCVRQINVSAHSASIQELEDIINAVNYINKNSKIYIVYRYWILKNIKIDDNLILNKLIDSYSLNEHQKSEILNNKNIKIRDYLYVNKDIEFEWPNTSLDYYSEEGHCLGLTSHIGILSDGTVVPCCLDSEGIINLGNIFNDKLEDIINSQLYQEMLKGFRNNKRICELCKHCSFNMKKQ